MRSRRLGVTWLFVIVLILAGCGGSSGGTTKAPAAAKGDAAKGKAMFAETCSTCHGLEGKGMPNLGKDMTTSQFIKSQSDDQLLAFINKGRQPGEKDNTTGVAMPPKGGNPALDDAKLTDIIAFIRTISK